MKFIKILVLLSCFISLIFTRKTKKRFLDSEITAFTKIQCLNVNECSQACNHYKININNVINNCDVIGCDLTKKVCSCSPKSLPTLNKGYKCYDEKNSFMAKTSKFFTEMFSKLRGKKGN